MQRVQREVTDVEMIDALNDIIDLIIENYDAPVRPEFQKDSRAAQIGHDIVQKLKEREILSRYANIGYQAQRQLLEKKIIKTGGIA